MGRLRWIVLGLLSVSMSVFAESPPFSWPALPEPGSLKKELEFKSQTGLLVLERRVKLEINAFQGISREEFVRILVQNDQGVRNASLQIQDRPDSRAEKVEGRTIQPDGSILPLQPANDIHWLEIQALNKRESLVSLARVDFPAPSKGSLLDLHFVTRFEGLVFFFLDLVPFAQSPSLKTDYEITVQGGIPGSMWSALALGGGSGGGQIQQKGPHSILVHFGPLIPGDREPLSPPPFHHEATILLYLRWENLEARAEKVAEQVSLDSKGRPTKLSFEPESIRKWWVKALEEKEEACRNFLRKPGRAKDLNVESIAPSSLPLEERIRRLYTTSQETIGFNPDADRNTDLADAMRAGQNHVYQGTLLFSYLLQRAGIPHQRVWIANRYSLRFSPVIMHSWLYGFVDAVRVEVSAGRFRYYIPGLKDLPCGSLPLEYQDSFALWLEKDTLHPSYAITPLNSMESDQRRFAFTLMLDPQGNGTGEVAVSDTGTGGGAFREWYRERTFRQAHPKREERKKALKPEELAAQMEKMLRQVAVVPSPDVVLDAPQLESFPTSSQDPLRIAARFTAKATARESGGNQWLLAAFPLMTGYESPFKENQRQRPIWYERSGVLVHEGYTLLPPGARVLDLPPPIRWTGPEGAYFVTKVEAVEKDGKPALYSKMEIALPATAGWDAYAALRSFHAELASAAGARCLVEWPREKVLE